MKRIWTVVSGAALALSMSAVFAQAPAPKAAPAAKADPKVAECRAHNQAEHKSLMEMHAKAMKEHMISPQEQKEFRAMEGRLARHRQVLSKGGLTLAECDKLGKEIAHEKTVLAKMASTPAKAPAKK
jgi:hypothetical protein